MASQFVFQGPALSAGLPPPSGPGGLGLQLPPGIGPPPALPKLPFPGLPPPGSLDSEALAQMRFQQVATEYEQIKNAGIDPQVSELAEYHGLDDRATRALDEEMKKRRATFESDLQALWVGLEGAKNPSGMLMMKLKDMRMGTFKGMTALDKQIHDFAKRNRLDAQAAVKLAEVLHNRDDIEADLSKIQKHLERSNKPSSLVMMMLRDLREGKPIKELQEGRRVESQGLLSCRSLGMRQRLAARSEPLQLSTAVLDGAFLICDRSDNEAEAVSAAGEMKLEEVVMTGTVTETEIATEIGTATGEIAIETETGSGSMRSEESSQLTLEPQAFEDFRIEGHDALALIPPESGRVEGSMPHC
ncbi:unnamed protein product [Symbiodinium sp. CCMP2456]|nr:unnamed protein product [Symbiodinium sp. CCMP2456]